MSNNDNAAKQQACAVMGLWNYLLSTCVKVVVAVGVLGGVFSLCTVSTVSMFIFYGVG
jgi:hypothetical protein